MTTIAAIQFQSLHDYEKNVKNLHDLYERNHAHRLYVE